MLELLVCRRVGRLQTAQTDGSAKSPERHERVLLAASERDSVGHGFLAFRSNVKQFQIMRNICINRSQCLYDGTYVAIRRPHLAHDYQANIFEISFRSESSSSAGTCVQVFPSNVRSVRWSTNVSNVDNLLHNAGCTYVSIVSVPSK